MWRVSSRQLSVRQVQHRLPSVLPAAPLRPFLSKRGFTQQSRVPFGLIHTFYTSRNSNLCQNGRNLQARSFSTEQRAISKVLIANRGEIACRVIKTCKSLGIRTVAVYSEADRAAMHVEMADEAYFIGNPPATESYLRYEKILEIAKKSGAQAIHPGYGFLSENANFAEACERENIEFIGPPASAIRSMGSKSESKNIMLAAGVPCVPGYHGEDQSLEVLKAEADKIGYPVMLKAVLGGGGKGMRIVWKAEDFEASLDGCKREALKSFSDERVLIEKYLQRPRHIEYQVFGDKKGNYVYLFERDCSVQRRHQKVIEEAPAPGMDEKLREKMGIAAVNAAKAVGYVGAGTVEFIVDAADESFYFMEMNTRLQVEHPVTEMITGEDLVDWQLQVAEGRSLPASQSELMLRGHAFEARIYAENPDSDFLPATGKLVHLDPPETSSSVRVDTGVRQGDEVSIYYDPMISKLIVWDTDRNKALEKLCNALHNYRVIGLPTNISFVARVASHPAFIKGKVETNFIPDYADDLLPPPVPASSQAFALAAVHILEAEAAAKRASAGDSLSPWDTLTFNVNHAPQRVLQLKDRDTVSDVTVTTLKEHTYSVKVNGEEHQIRSEPSKEATEEQLLRVEFDGEKLAATVLRNGNEVHLFIPSSDPSATPASSFVLTIPERNFDGETATEGSLVSPMPGKIVKVLVKQGDKIKKGQALLILEAMKMEHTILAPSDGIVESVNYVKGDLVEEKKVLVQIESGDTSSA